MLPAPRSLWIRRKDGQLVEVTSVLTTGPAPMVGFAELGQARGRVLMTGHTLDEFLTAFGPARRATDGVMIAAARVRA